MTEVVVLSSRLVTEVEVLSSKSRDRRPRTPRSGGSARPRRIRGTSNPRSSARSRPGCRPTTDSSPVPVPFPVPVRGPALALAPVGATAAPSRSPSDLRGSSASRRSSSADRDPAGRFGCGDRCGICPQSEIRFHSSVCANFSKAFHKIQTFSEIPNYKKTN